MGVDYQKRSSETIAVDVPVDTAKLSGAFPTGGTASASPAGLTVGTGSPLAAAVRFTVSGGSSGTTYVGTAEITLSDGRTVEELFEVVVQDTAMDADLTLTIGGFPPSSVYTNLDSARDVLGDFGIKLRVDDDANGGISPRERQTVTKLAYVASSKARMYCQGYDENLLKQSWSLWWYATVIYARMLCLREGNPNPPGVWELYVEALQDLKDIKNGNLQLVEIPVQLDPEPSWSNVRIDPIYAEKQLRVQQRISDQSYTRFKRFRDTYDQFVDEPDV